MTTQAMTRLRPFLEEPGRLNLSLVADGYEAVLLSEILSSLSEKSKAPQDVVFVARDGQRAADIQAAMAFFAPWAEVLHVPAWDCLPWWRLLLNKKPRR